jgi:polyribonucleotide nucleotidyltransferase
VTSPRACTARRCSTAAETQILSNVALARPALDMRIDTLAGRPRRSSAPLQLPALSVGEAGFHARPKRRDIGTALSPSAPWCDDPRRGLPLT